MRSKPNGKLEQHLLHQQHRKRIRQTSSFINNRPSKRLMRLTRHFHETSFQFQIKQRHRQLSVQNHRIMNKLYQPRKLRYPQNPIEYGEQQQRSRTKKRQQQQIHKIQQNDQLSERISSVKPTVNLSSIKKSFLNSRKYKRLNSQSQFQLQSLRSPWLTVFTSKIRPLPPIYFEVVFTLLQLKMRLPKGPLDEFKLQLQIVKPDKQPVLKRHLQILHLQHELSQHGFQLIKKSSAVLQQVNLNAIQIRSQQIKFQALLKNTFVFKGGSAIHDAQLAQLYLNLIHISDREKNLGTWKLYSGECTQPVLRNGEPVGQVRCQTNIQLQSKGVSGVVVNKILSWKQQS